MGQQEARGERQVVGDLQRIAAPDPGIETGQRGAVEQVVEGPIRPLDPWVVGEVRVPANLVDATGLFQRRHHREAPAQDGQFAVFPVGRAQRRQQVGILAGRQQVEVAAEQPGRAPGLQFVEQRTGGLDLALEGVVVRLRAVEAGVEHGQLAAAVDRQVADQDRRARPEQAVEQPAVAWRQLAPLGAIDAIAAQGGLLAADAAEDVRRRHEGRLPLVGLGAAMVEIVDALLDQRQLVLIVGGAGAVVDLLEQDQVRLLVADHPDHLVEGERQVFGGGTLVRAGGIRQVVPEDVALAGQVLDVPGHHLQGLPRLQRRRGALAMQGRGFAIGGLPAQQVAGEQGTADQQEQADEQQVA